MSCLKLNEISFDSLISEPFSHHKIRRKPFQLVLSLAFTPCSSAQLAAGDPLAMALKDDSKLQTLLTLLREELPPQGRVLLGATAGVRQALQDLRLDNARWNLLLFRTIYGDI